MSGSARTADRSSSMRLLARRLIATCCAAAVIGVGGQALAAGTPPPGMPPTGHTRLGGSWVKWHGVSTQIAKATSSHRIAMITLGVTRVSDRHKFSPGELASGKADSIYLSYSSQANAADVPVWIRPMQEMNGSWMSYCAFNANGTRRGVSYSTGRYKNAFRR